MKLDLRTLFSWLFLQEEEGKKGGGGVITLQQWGFAPHFYVILESPDAGGKV